MPGSIRTTYSISPCQPLIEIDEEVRGGLRLRPRQRLSTMRATPVRQAPRRETVRVRAATARRIVNGYCLGVGLQEEIERVVHGHVGDEIDLHLERLDLFRKHDARKEVAVRILLPVQEMSLRFDRRARSSGCAVRLCAAGRNRIVCASELNRSIVLVARLMRERHVNGHETFLGTGDDRRLYWSTSTIATEPRTLRKRVVFGRDIAPIVTCNRTIRGRVRTFFRAVNYRFELRHTRCAIRSRVRATRMKATADRRFDRRRHVALQHDARLAPRLAIDRIRHRNRRQQRARVRVSRTARRSRARSRARRSGPRYITATSSDMCFTTARSCAMKISARFISRCRCQQQVQHLRLDRYIERGNRFVADDQLRAQRDCSRNADALPLPS